MKSILKLVLVSVSLILFSCGNGEEKDKETISYDNATTKTKETKATTPSTSEPASQKVDLTNKGIGPIKSVSLDAEINQEMATKGKEIYTAKCTACHKAEKKFIGPAPKGILERRTPEWVMNMILNPEGMVREDALAKELLVEFNSAPMANQNLTEEEARTVLEYFRTLK